MDASSNDKNEKQPQSFDKKDEAWDDLKGIVPEHLMPQGAPRGELDLPDLPDPPGTAHGKESTTRKSATLLGWLREKFPEEDATRLADYYSKGYGPELHSCLEKNGWRKGVDAALNEDVVQDYIHRALASGHAEYVWRSRADELVCSRCASNSGKAFRYDTAPPGGHPGLAAGCRCWAEPVTLQRKIQQLGKKQGSSGCLLPTLTFLLVSYLFIAASI